MKYPLTLERALWWLGVVVLLGLIALIAYQGQDVPSLSDAAATTTPSFAQSISDGAVTVSYPDSFGLATNSAQVLVHAYIPPCDPGFTYCVYYTGSAYAGTNFESAGLRIQKRPDLASQNGCLFTPPAGYGADTHPRAATSTGEYAASVFAPMGDAAVGHYANGSLYRLFDGTTATCYEFETRIGETQYANYPAGSIKEFTAADRAALTDELNRMMAAVSLHGHTDLFPAP